MSRLQDVEEAVIDMKDTSALMADLAYSAVFYSSNGLASLVAELEEEVGEELKEFQRLCLESVREGDLTIEQALVLLRVAQVSEAIANSAMEIADVVLRDVDLHPILQESIRESDTNVTKLVLHPESQFCGHTLRELQLETETGMRVLAVRRGGRWHPAVKGSFRLQPEDLLIAVGPDESEAPFRQAAGAEEGDEG